MNVCCQSKIKWRVTELNLLQSRVGDTSCSGLETKDGIGGVEISATKKLGKKVVEIQKK